MGTVTFYRTTTGGQREVAEITLDTRGLRVTSGDDNLLALLLGDIDPEDIPAVGEAMRDAPRRFDGAYLRASFEE